MDLNLTDIQEMLADSARALLAAEASNERLGEVEQSEAGFDPDLWARIAELGWVAQPVPEAQGGFGGSPLDLGVLLECFGEHAVAAPFFQTATGALLLGRVGSGATNEELLGRIGAGEVRVALAERTRDVRLRGVLKAEMLVLSGGPILVEWAQAADALIAAVECAEGVVLAQLNPREDGLLIEPVRAFDNERVAWLTASDVSIGVERGLLVNEPLNVSRWRDEAALLRALRAAEMVGGARRALEMSVAYVSARKQFGVALGTFQAVQHICADAKIEIDALQLLTRSALWRAGEALPFSRHSCYASFFAARMADRVFPSLLQIHGGIGYTREYPLHFYYRRGKAQALRLGSTARQLREIASRTLPLEPGASLRSELMDWPLNRSSSSVPT